MNPIPHNATKRLHGVISTIITDTAVIYCFARGKCCALYSVADEEHKQAIFSILKPYVKPSTLYETHRDELHPRSGKIFPDLG